MSLQYPSIVPVGYAGDYSDFFRVKQDRSGAVRSLRGSVSIPSGTTSGIIVGLFPFLKGFHFDYASFFNVAALGTSVTLALGYYYEDSTLTSNTAGFLAASTTAAAGGVLTPNVVAGSQIDAAGEGWVVALVGGATTGSTGSVTYNALFDYDISGVSN